MSQRAATPASGTEPQARLASGADARDWIVALKSDGAPRDEALARLHALLLRAARFEVARRRRASAPGAAHDLEDLAMQAADDALVAVIAKLDDFRGHSRFTTWAYKFAVLEAAVKMRRRPWHGREVSLDPESWPDPPAAGDGPSAQTERAELLRAIRRAVESELTPHQREVLVAIALNGVPIDVLAERLGTTRGALYKTVHDARRKLRARLVADGYALDIDEGSSHG
jgi:RNA polymerase sigma-70 factor (ECF subfamily)